MTNLLGRKVRVQDRKRDYDKGSPTYDKLIPDGPSFEATVVAVDYNKWGFGLMLEMADRRLTSRNMGGFGPPEVTLVCS